MPTKIKIKIEDDENLRKILDNEYEESSQIKLCKYALLLATHVLETIRYADADNPIIKQGYDINEKWQAGKARAHDVRQIGFEIHKLAKLCTDSVTQTALRVVGQAVAVAHMREHAMVASDYAIKVINLLRPFDTQAVANERLWQINRLHAITDLWR